MSVIVSESSSTQERESPHHEDGNQPDLWERFSWTVHERTQEAVARIAEIAVKAGLSIEEKFEGSSLGGIAAGFRYNAEKLGMAVEKEIFDRQLVRADGAVRRVQSDIQSGVGRDMSQQPRGVFEGEKLTETINGLIQASTIYHHPRVILYENGGRLNDKKEGLQEVLISLANQSSEARVAILSVLEAAAANIQKSKEEREFASRVLGNIGIKD